MAKLATEDFVLGRRLLGVVDVGASADPADDLTLFVAHRHRTAERPTIVAAVVAQPIFDFIWLAGSETVSPFGPRAVLVVRVKHAVPRFPVGRAVRHTGELIPAGIEIIVIAVGQRRPHHVRQRIGQCLESRVALAESILSGDQLCF